MISKLDVIKFYEFMFFVNEIAHVLKHRILTLFAVNPCAFISYITQDLNSIDF